VIDAQAELLTIRAWGFDILLSHTDGTRRMFCQKLTQNVT